MPVSGMRFDLAQQLLMQRAVVAGAFLIENDQVGPEAAQSPVGVRQQQLREPTASGERRATVTASMGRSPEIP